VYINHKQPIGTGWFTHFMCICVFVGLLLWFMDKWLNGFQCHLGWWVAWVLKCTGCTLCLQKNDTDVAQYNFTAHQPIFVIFGRDIAEW